MNWNKYTKAELISKFKNIETSNKNNKQNNINSLFRIIREYFIQLWGMILLIKNLLIKITLISLIVRIFNKYKIIRRMWHLFNSVVMIVFGISVFDAYGFDFVKTFLIEIKVLTYNIINYLSETTFYNFVYSFFTNNEKLNQTRNNAVDVISEKESENLNNKNKREYGRPW